MSGSTNEPTVEELARYRARHYLLNKWERQLEEADLDDTTGLVRGYNPSGCTTCVDVPEISGLFVRTDAGETHLRLYRDSTIGFISAGCEEGAPIQIDPMTDPTPGGRYLSAGVSDPVREVLEALDVTPRWGDACPDGEHNFTAENEGHSAYKYTKCAKCDKSAELLSWLGHRVPYRLGGDD